MNRKHTRFVQDYLNRRGFEAGPVDGINGSQTQNAIAKFQQNMGIEPTGQLTENLIEKIRGWDKKDFANIIEAPGELQSSQGLDKRSTTPQSITPDWAFGARRIAIFPGFGRAIHDTPASRPTGHGARRIAIFPGFGRAIHDTP